MIKSQFFDTHTHLDDSQFASDIDAVIAEATALGVEGFVNIGFSPATWPSTLELARRYPQVRYALGLHPGRADEWSEDLLTDLTRLIEETRPVAVGEIGLDYYWTTETRRVQWQSFERQLELAHYQQLPVIIHQRDAATDVASILAGVPPSLMVILHSFDGDPVLMTMARDRGWLIGVGGLMTRRQSLALRSSLPDFPLEQIILETDSPYLVPSGVKTRRNTPAQIPLIAERLAGLIDRPIEEVAALTTRNAERAFKISVEVSGA